MGRLKKRIEKAIRNALRRNMTIYDVAPHRPDERFHLQTGAPELVSFFDVGLPSFLGGYKFFRRAIWHMVDGYFVSYWLFNHLQLYYGNMKCDGSRTIWSREKGVAGSNEYVITTTPKEMLAFRWRRSGPDAPLWDRMGGA